MHLYTQSQSPNGQRVAVFMKEKGVDIPLTEIDLRGAENLADEHANNPIETRLPKLFTWAD